MSYIIGGGGGLTIDEIKTALKVGEAGGVPITTSTGNLVLTGDSIGLKSGNSVPASIAIKSGPETLIRASRANANTFPLYYLNNGVLSRVLGETDRNGATNTAVAAIYNPCKTILNEHRPVCTKEYHLTGKYLDGADNPDVWFPIKGVGTGAAVTYSDRVLTLNSGSGMDSASRCVIDQTKFPIASNFLEVTCEIANLELGEGGDRRIMIGFMSAFSAYNFTERVGLTRMKTGEWLFTVGTLAAALTTCPLGRDLASGDIVTVRLDREEGSPNIDIARLYVNGQKQVEYKTLPTVNLYAGIGAFATSLTDVACSIGIKYFGVRYVP